jgi:hypothetical protein
VASIRDSAYPQQYDFSRAWHRRYCLPKDGGLGVWAYHTLMGFEDDIFKITPLAIDINDTRALHVAQLVRDALRNMSKIVAASRIALLGASYREDVGDTRYSGSELIVRKLTEMGGEWGDENHQKTGFKLIPFLFLITQAEQK